jgi:predicted nucleotidyltransferase
MVPVITQRSEELRRLCDRFHVARLELFGSAASGEFKPERSDLDFLVSFKELRTGEYADSYFGLLLALEELFGRHVDLVMTSAIRNPYFLQAIEPTRTLIYAG